MAGYEFFYPGTTYSLEPSYGNLIGYNIPTGGFGLTLDPRTAAAVQDASMKLSTGVKTIEVEGISPEVFESIPQQSLKEINRVSKLTGIDVTLHGPLVEASGFGREGWNEASREAAARQIQLALERAHELNPKGNIPVTFHSTAQLPEMLERVKAKGVQKEKAMYIVEPRTGRTDLIRETEKFFPGEKKEFNPEQELDKKNKDIWTETVGNINVSAYRGMEIVRDFEKIPEKLGANLPEGELNETIRKAYKSYAESRKKPEEFEKLPPEVKTALEEGFRYLDHGAIFLRDSYRGLRDLYNMVYKEAKEGDKEKLDRYAKEISPFVEKGVEKDPEKLREFSELIERGIKILNSIETPKIFVPLNKFIIDKSAETFGEAAFKAYDKFKDTAPMICVENPPAGGGLSRAEDIKKLIEESRKKFIQKAKEEGYSESEARKAAEKLIGATWDVGHINMLRKYGYDKIDIIKETEKIAPLVKHVHLSDNFGFEHTELPMGMGNVPIKEIMEKLGKQGFEAKKIIEAASWWQHMKTPPVVPTLEAFGSPLYPMLAQPSWNQIAGTYGNYFGFPSSYFPEQHFSLYGGGFAGLPQELGGQIPGKQSRLSGTPTA